MGGRARNRGLTPISHILNRRNQRNRLYYNKKCRYSPNFSHRHHHNLPYGIGGELQNRYPQLAAFTRRGVTDDKRKGATVMFSQEGYDFNLRLNVPQLDFLKVRTDYYNYHGKYGGGNDKGLRYGLEIQPINDLRIGAYYDDGGEKFGGDIAYVYNFGNRQLSQKRESTADFSPDLFSPIVREYSQRIMTAQLGPQLRIITTAMTINTGTMITPQMVFTNTMTMAGMTTILTTETPTMTATRMASVYFTARLDFTHVDGDGNRIPTFFVITTTVKYFVTLPPISQTRPIIITTRRSFDAGSFNEAIIIEEDTPVVVPTFARGNPFDFSTSPIRLTLTIAEGSEDFISVAITLTTENTTTVPHIITETPTTIEMMTITTKLTTFATSTITIGAEITTGAAKVDSPLPPSFPPFPQVPKLALAANPRISPSFPPFYRHSRAGGNDN